MSRGERPELVAATAPQHLEGIVRLARLAVNTRNSLYPRQSLQDLEGHPERWPVQGLSPGPALDLAAVEEPARDNPLEAWRLSRPSPDLRWLTAIARQLWSIGDDVKAQPIESRHPAGCEDAARVGGSCSAD